MEKLGHGEYDYDDDGNYIHDDENEFLILKTLPCHQGMRLV